MFHDRARLTVIAGRGGDGSLHFRREKFVPKGGPDGGDGGKGGDVVLVADPRRRDLSGFRPNQKLRAGSGGPGRGSLANGAEGEDAVLHVPVGTQVLDEEGRLVADLAHPGARVVVARGGAGGRGNKRFASATRQTPRFAEVGWPGEEGVLELRLKLLADAALVGLPNAGKSSLIARLSNARPKVADYPFTTLAPVLGTVEAADGRQLVVADVPGLIEGASEGVGLGHEFLAHLERARLLLHVIDSSQGDPDERWRTIEAELSAYGAGLDTRPQIVVLNKIDLQPEPPSFAVEDERIVRVLRVSAATGAGIDELKRALFELAPADEVTPTAPGDEQELVDYLVYRPQPARRAYRVFRTERGFRVSGRAPAGEELERVLRAAGAREGDEVEVGGDVLEWQP
jgi:GTP-binding protein